METKSTYWRVQHAAHIKKELAKSIWQYVTSHGERNEDGSHTLCLSNEVWLDFDGDELCGKYPVCKVVATTKRHGRVEHAGTVSLVFKRMDKECSADSINLSIDSTLLLLDTIDYQIFPEG